MSSNIEDHSLFLKKIKDKVDEFALKYGYGHIEFKLELKDGKVKYIEWHNHGREKVDIR